MSYRGWTHLLALPLLLAGSACVRSIPDATPADIPALEAALATSPEDAQLQSRLGIARFRQGNHAAAVELLEAAIEDGADDGATYLHLGLANEELGEYALARSAYTRYLEVGRSGSLMDEIQERLRLIVRQELQAAAAAAVAQEAQLTDAAPTPRSIAVLPLRPVSDNPDYEVLGLALADMMITDFSLTNALTVLERAQIQALVDEMNLTEAGLAEPNTGARSGRMLRAEHVVQGAVTVIGTEAVEIDTDVVNTEAAASAGSAQGADALEQIFDAEKEVVFGVIELLGIELTPAEVEAINENRAANLLAFLAYGRGLRALDGGDYVTAAEEFAAALDLDAGFDRAAQLSDDVGAFDRQLERPTGTISNDSEPEFERPVESPPPPPLRPSTITNVGNGVNPRPNGGQFGDGSTNRTGGNNDGTGRDPVQEAAGADGAPGTTRTTVRISIPRPGGAVGSILLRIGR